MYIRCLYHIIMIMVIIIILVNRNDKYGLSHIVKNIDLKRSNSFHIFYSRKMYVPKFKLINRYTLKQFYLIYLYIRYIIHNIQAHIL